MWLGTIPDPSVVVCATPQRATAICDITSNSCLMREGKCLKKKTAF